MSSQTERKKSNEKRAEILRCGRELFSARGYKDTSVADITAAAGIAAGTFYLYYTSKEKLFMELFLEENVKLKRAILESLDTDGEPFIVIRQLVQQNMAGMTANPILREWYNKDVFRKIEEHYRQENGLERVDFLYDIFLEIVRGWQARGRLRADIDSEMIMALFSTVIVVDVHKEEIGIQYFPKVEEYLTEFILDGLAARPNPAGGEG